MKLDIKKQLESNLIPFWKTLIDQQNGGFFGYMDNNLVIDKKANKTIIAHSRYLFTFSYWYRYSKDSSLLRYMKHAYDYLEKVFKDEKYGGYYWEVDYLGKKVIKSKHVYGQAFVIYGLSEYALAIKDENIANKAYQLFELIEEKAHLDYFYYNEQFDQKWQLELNKYLSVDEKIYPFTTNTILHILEAYSNLYKVKPTQKLRRRLLDLIDGFKNILYNKKEKSFYMALDYEFKPTHNGLSYGHDIETCWLLDRAVEVLKIKDETLDKIIDEVALNVLKYGVTENGIIAGKNDSGYDKERVWWAQVEAMIGFMNQYQKTKDIRFFQAIKDIYQFSKKYLIDQRKNSEWFWGVDENLIVLNKPIVEGWKTPYHIGRAYVELLERGVESVDSSDVL